MILLADGATEFAFDKPIWYGPSRNPQRLIPKQNEWEVRTYDNGRVKHHYLVRKSTPYYAEPFSYLRCRGDYVLLSRAHATLEDFYRDHAQKAIKFLFNDIKHCRELLGGMKNDAILDAIEYLAEKLKKENPPENPSEKNI